jgi:threonine/homoserine/homoserine lactone efflux protein
MVHITYCLLGIGLIISRSILAFSVLKYAAAMYLVYVGIVSIRSGGKTPDMSDIENNLLNPKGTLFYLGVFTTVITPKTPVSSMVVFIFSMMVVSGSFWLLFVCTLDRRVVREFVERSQETVSRIFGVLLVLVGLRVATMSP